ncbi:hypothetical protein [Rhodospirillum rubrum]|uniref:hypothetical protein n=2 Tax=Rhodospirillum rubrum TaxID=1085 RepID=UPI0002F76193|nr:hypothetical protein [Rhodospirillum rubrum]
MLAGGPAGQQRKAVEARLLPGRAIESLAVFARVHQRLPCPDGDGDGRADSRAGPCAAPSGALPWADLGLPLSAARDGRGGRLVYEVSPGATLPTALACDGPLPAEALRLRDRPALVIVGAAATGQGVASGLLRTMMGCPPAPAAPAGALALPTTVDALAAQTPIVWRTLADGSQDSGATRLALDGQEIHGEGGTLAADAPGAGGDRGLGVTTTAPPLSDLSDPFEAGALGIDADGTPRRLIVRYTLPRARLALTLSGFEAERRVDYGWRRAHDPWGLACLGPADDSGGCAVAWLEGASLKARRAGATIGEVTLRACAESADGSQARFPAIGFGGQTFDELILTPLLVEDGQGATRPGEGSTFRLGALTAAPCPSPCPASPGGVLRPEGCP